MNFSYKQIWLIAYPILISLLMEHMINVTDTAFLGHVGEVELVVNEYHDCAFHHCNTGFRAVFILAVSGNIVGYKCSFYGRFSGGYFVRSNLSGSQYVSVGEGCFQFVPCPSFYGNDANHALWRRWVYPSLAVGCDTLYLPVAGPVAASSFKTSYRKS